ncbi:DoxX family protein [Corynebacterium sphenisci]|uniref:DoxX family protein n=1 Tax=Corynebacterium sphenisci TaxID=191493 RepID=UPI0026E0DEB6|nr:DoxX family protein [Corynebacterium sphenisci]MDO5730373.1 DoxX family protein [Corynebacterium sphenisci]
MIRKLARPMLASVFIADGVDTLKNPGDHVDGAREVLQQVRRVTPPQYVGLIPDSPTALVQAAAGAKVGAASLYALGRAPRLAAGALAVIQVPTALARHSFWATSDAEEKKNRRTGFLTDIALLGGLFLASADTAGKPGLAWRANKAGEQVNKRVRAALPTKTEAEKTREELAGRAAEFGEAAREKAAVLADRAAASTAAAGAYVEENKDDWRDAVASFAGDARDAVVGAAGEAREKLHELAEEADVESTVADLRKSSGRAARKARRRAEKAARKTRGKLRKLS